MTARVLPAPPQTPSPPLPASPYAGAPVRIEVSDGAITLVLHDVVWLFHAPVFDPLSGVYDKRTGFEQVLDTLAASGPLRRQPVRRLRILLPAAQIDAHGAGALATALKAYCATRISEAGRSLAKMREQRRTALQMGLLFLAVCLMLSMLIDQIQILPSYLRRLGAEGFLIAGWVGMWRPMELMLFDWWPPVRRRSLHARLLEMPVDVEPLHGEHDEQALC